MSNECTTDNHIGRGGEIEAVKNTTEDLLCPEWTQHHKVYLLHLLYREDSGDPEVRQVTQVAQG